MNQLSYETKELCEKNKRYNKYNTVLPAIFDYENLIKNVINKNNFYENKKIRETFNIIIDSKLSSDVYNFVNYDSMISTANYLFYMLGVGIYVEIKDNKIKTFLPFNNLDFNNNITSKIKLPSKYKDLNDFYKKKDSIYPINKKQYHLYDKNKWYATDCLLQTERGKDIIVNDTYWTQLKDLIDETCKNRTIPDVIFFINKKDLPFLKKNRTNPFESILGKNYKLDFNKYYYFHPILSQSTRDEFADIPIPSSDEWEFIKQEYFVNFCKNNYVLDKIKKVKWEDKINTAFFRGRGTGCSLDIVTNPRLHITKINNDWLNNDKYNHNNKIDGIRYLDAGIISYPKRTKVNNGVMDFNDPNDLKEKGVNLVDYVDQEHQNKYKYVIYIEGNSAAYRLSYMLSNDYVVLKVKSKFKLWYEELLKEYEHYVPIKEDLSDLSEIIKWCKQNDSKCKEIMINANNFCKKYFSKDYIYDYMSIIMTKISNKQFNNEKVNDRYKEYKDKRNVLEKELVEVKSVDSKTKVAIIVPYRDNKIQNRSEQLNKFIKFWEGKNVKVFIIEQSDDNRKFNRGQLLNLGFLLAEKENFDNYIFHDVDLIPSEELLPYYFYKSDYPLHLGNNWDKYTFYAFFGGVVSFNKKLFRESGGYPNNFFGWGGEDDVLQNRVAKLVDKKLVPKTGKYNEMKHTSTSEVKSLTISDVIKKKLILDSNDTNDLNSLKTKEFKYKKLGKYIFKYIFNLI